MSDYPVGIYLGTNDPPIAIWENNNICVIQNNNGDYTTPSVVSFITDYILGVLINIIK